jgi:hypothetical protein
MLPPRPEPALLSERHLLEIDPPVFPRAFKHALPYLQYLLTGQRRDIAYQQFGDFLSKFRLREHVAHLFLVRRFFLRQCLGCCGDYPGRHDRGSGPSHCGRLVPRIGFVLDQARGERLPAAVACHDLEFYFPSRRELVRVAIEYRCVQKYIFAAVTRRDKAIAARLIKLQHPARSQL